MSPAAGSDDLPGPVPPEPLAGRGPDPRAALDSWREALESLQQTTRSLTEDLTALRHGVAGGLRELRRAELWEAGRSPEQVVDVLAAGLEAAQAQVAARAEALVVAQRRAADAANAAVRRLVEDARQAARDAAVPEELSAPVSQRLESLGQLTRGMVTALRTDLSTLQDRLQAALSVGEEKARREIVDALGTIRASLEDLRLEMKDVSEPALGTLRTLQPSIEELSRALEARVDAAVAEIREVRGDLSERTGAPPGERLDEALASAEARIVQRLTETMDQRPGGTDDKAARQALARNASALKSEVHALRERIEGWGKPRTAPRLAEEVHRLGARVEELDQAIDERLAPQVANRIRASLDRRLRTLLGDLPDQLREAIAEAVQEAAAASAQAARDAVREAADDAVRDATAEIREALQRPAPSPEPRPRPEPRRRFFR